jgi:histidinol-phosphate aminotransferase
MLATVDHQSLMYFEDVPEDFLRFDYSDSKFPPAPGVIEAIREAASSVNFYPRDPSARLLRKKLAEIYHLDPDWFLVTNGLDEAIDLITRAFVAAGKEIIIPIPTFSMFQTAGEWAKARIVSIPCMKGRKYCFNPKEILQAVTKKTNLIWICNPNNPTGDIISTESIVDVLENADSTMVAVDECYFEFALRTALPFVEKKRNLLVLRSFSKGYCLAGMRIGFICAHPEVVKKIGEMKQTFSVNVLAQKAAIACLGEPDYYKKVRSELKKERDFLAHKLSKFPGVKVHRSKTNFLLIDIEKSGHDSREIFEKLWRRKMVVLPDYHPEFVGLGKNFLRITVSNRKENERLLSALKAIIILKKSESDYFECQNSRKVS